MKPRKHVWIEGNKSRCLMTNSGPFPVYEGEFIMVIAGNSLEDCQRLFCGELLRTRGEFKPPEEPHEP